MQRMGARNTVGVREPREVRAVRAPACPRRNEEGIFFEPSRNAALHFDLPETRSFGMLPPIIATDCILVGASGAPPARRNSSSRGGFFAGAPGRTVRRVSTQEFTWNSDTSVSSPSNPIETGFVIVGTLTNAKHALSTLTNMGEGTLQLVSVPLPGSASERSLGILWCNISSAPYCQSVRVRLIAAGQTLVDETLTWQRFPSSSAGMLTLASIPSGKIVVELTLSPSNEPDSWSRLLAAQSFGEQFPFVLAF